MPETRDLTETPEPRFVVDDFGDGKLRSADRDTATELSYDPTFTRQSAQRSADLRNREASQ